MELLKRLPSPVGLSREEIMEILYREEYGYPPPPPTSVTAKVVKEENYFFERKAALIHLDVTITGEFGSFPFPVRYAKLKQAEGPVPAFIHINFYRDIPNKYQPTEEILDGGFNLFSVYFNDITIDDPHFVPGNFKDGLAGVIYKDGVRPDDAGGKLVLWAWTMSALLTYVRTLPEIDGDCVSVIGHSRMGKTALLAGAMDPRFFCAISNNSGASGAAIMREKTGETLRAIYEHFPFWFCKKYAEYFDNEDALPFDQHFLLAANATHRVYVGSGSYDKTACPEHEYLSAVAASEYFESVGKTGLGAPEEYPAPWSFFHDGHIGFHLRDGGHFLGRYDWNMYMTYIKKHYKKK